MHAVSGQHLPLTAAKSAKRDRRSRAPVRRDVMPYRTECLALISVISDDVGRAFMFITVHIRIADVGRLAGQTETDVCRP